MSKTRSKLISILCAFLFSLGFGAYSQQLVVHKLADGALIDGASYDVLKYTANVSIGNESIVEIKNTASVGSLKITLTDNANKKLQYPQKQLRFSINLLRRKAKSSSRFSNIQLCSIISVLRKDESIFDTHKLMLPILSHA